MQFRPEQVYTFVAFVSSVLGMWSILSAKMTKQENRNTVLEKDIENLKEFKESANHRLNSHDEQNKAILVTVGIINDPTTAGIKDSEQALAYYEPKGE